jgi:hypothetical protein
MRRFAWIPILIVVAVVLPALTAYYFNDDFAWMSLKGLHDQGQSVVSLVFRPAGHGTWRPLSERVTFLLAETWFPSNPLPFHALVLLTHCLSLYLFYGLAFRLTGSRLAAIAAPLIWSLNPSLAQTYAWSSSYMHLLCACFLLAELSALLAYLENGRARWLALTWGLFLTGFLVMESNLVFPALALVLIVMRNALSRRIFVRVLAPFGAVSVLFVLLHMHFAPKQASGLYSLSYHPLDLIRVVARYTIWTVRPFDIDRLARLPRLVNTIWAALALGSLGGFIGWRAFKKDYRPALAAAMFVILLAPMAPLRQHVLPYYLSLPSFGFALAAAWAAGAGLNGSKHWKILTVLILAGWAVMFPVALRRSILEWRAMSWQTRDFLADLGHFRARHPDKLLILSGFTPDIYPHCLFHNCTGPAGIGAVFIAPDWAAASTSNPGWPFNPEHFADPDSLQARLADGSALLVDYSDGTARDGSAATLAALRAGTYMAPHRMEGLDSRWLKEGWNAPEQGFRWMTRQATARLSGPLTATERLVVAGFCPDVPGRPEKLELKLTLNGRALETQHLAGCRGQFELSAAVPDELRPLRGFELKLETDNAYKVAGEHRELALAVARLGFE